MTDSLHKAAVLTLGALAGLFLYDARTRRFGWFVFACALALGIVEAFGADTCGEVRGYIAVSDDGNGQEGEHRADGQFIQISRLDSSVGYDEMTASVQTDPASWTPGCDAVAVSIDYSVAVESGFGVPQAAVWAGPFEADCTGAQRCQKDGSAVLAVRPGQASEGGMWMNGAMAGHTLLVFSGPFPVVTPRFSHQTKRAAKKVADGLDSYALAAGSGAGLAKLAKRLPIAKVLTATVAVAGTTSALIKEVLKHDPWDDKTTVFRPGALPMPSGIPTKYQPWVRNQLEIQRWWRGVFVALNRANTAVALKDAPNEDRQQGAIDGYMAKLATLYGREIAYRKKLAPDFRPYDVHLDEPELLAAYGALGAAG